jgi:hypothetical protein
MVDGDLFDKLAKIGSILRKKPMQPFGGIQVGLSIASFLTFSSIRGMLKHTTFSSDCRHWRLLPTSSRPKRRRATHVRVRSADVERDDISVGQFESSVSAERSEYV